jgi:CubicO group peptidase (beta-lactamase class C family)
MFFMNKRSFAISLMAMAVGSLSLFFISDVSGQGTAAAARQSDEQIVAKVGEYMNAAHEVDAFSGTILLARDGKPIVSRGYGMANIELDVPNTPETVFRLGSVTKQFTAMAIMMLQDRGKLSVNDPICKYLSDCPAAWQPITIRNLLTHTSGVMNYTDLPTFGKTAVSPMTTGEMIALLRDKPLEFAPGEKFNYSNSGYYLLGAVIEKASGKSYADFLQENIFTPLGMKQTGYDVSARIIKNRAEGYVRQGGQFFNASYMDMTLPYSAGALYSTTGDLLLWDQALYAEKLVPRKALDEIFTPFKSNYGYGWNISKQFDHREISHGGGIYGFATEIARYPDDKLTVIVLSNVQGAPAGKIANDLAAIYFGAKYEIPKTRVEIHVDPKILEKYVGDYQLAAPKILLTFTLENGRLFAQIAGQSKFALSAESETVFFSRDAPVEITFNKDSTGRTTGMTFKQGGATIPAQKIK